MNLHRRINDARLAMLEQIEMEQRRRVATALAFWRPYFEQLESQQAEAQKDQQSNNKE